MRPGAVESVLNGSGKDYYKKSAGYYYYYCGHCEPLLAVTLYIRWSLSDLLSSSSPSSSTAREKTSQ